MSYLYSIGYFTPISSYTLLKGNLYNSSAVYDEAKSTKTYGFWNNENRLNEFAVNPGSSKFENLMSDLPLPYINNANLESTKVPRFGIDTGVIGQNWWETCMLDITPLEPNSEREEICTGKRWAFCGQSAPLIKELKLDETYECSEKYKGFWKIISDSYHRAKLPITERNAVEAEQNKLGVYRNLIMHSDYLKRSPAKIGWEIELYKRGLRLEVNQLFDEHQTKYTKDYIKRLVDTKTYSQILKMNYHKRALEIFLAIGYPDILARNDGLRSIFYGNNQIFDSDSLNNYYECESDCPSRYMGMGQSAMERLEAAKNVVEKLPISEGAIEVLKAVSSLKKIILCQENYKDYETCPL